MRNPWRGLAAYTEPMEGEEEIKFCGRSGAIRTLTSLIEHNLFVTLYGMTGVGKTSLLQAGVFPKLRKDGFIPVKVRFVSVPEQTGYLQFMLESVIEELTKNGVSYAPFKLSPNKEKSPQKKAEKNYVYSFDQIQTPHDLRIFFATHVFTDKNGQITYPVIVLDQFEECIYKDNDKAVKLLEALHGLVDNSLYLPAIQKDYHEETNYRIVISIREDDLYLLEDIVDERGLGYLKNNRYRLRSLTEKEAEEVIVEPGKKFIPNGERGGVACHLIKQATEDGKINTLSLSLFCSLLFKRAGEAPITAALAEKLDEDLLESFYRETIKRLPKKERKYIEKELIDGNNGRRDSVSLSRFKENAKHAGYLFEDETRILQTVNGRVELVHDRLANSIFKMRNEERRSIWRRVATVCTVVALTCMLLFSFWSAFKSHFYSLETPLEEYIWEKNLTLSSGQKSVAGVKDTEHIISNNPDLSVRDCPVLKSVTLNSEESDVSFFLKNCPSLVEINIPKESKCVHLRIEGCPNLGPIKISDHVRKIFVRWADNELDFDIDQKNHNLKWKDGILYDIQNNCVDYVIPKIAEWQIAHIDSAMIRYRDIEIKNITNVPLEELLIVEGDTLKGIKDPFFSGCLNLSNNQEIKIIEENAFKDIKGISSVVFPDSLVFIGPCSFAGLDSIRSISFPPSLYGIGNFAFAGCENLREVSFSSLSTIPSSTSFLWCDNANYISVENSKQEDKRIEIRNNIVYKFVGDSVTKQSFYPCLFGEHALISNEELDFLKSKSVFFPEYLAGDNLYFPPSVKFTNNAKVNNKFHKRLNNLSVYCEGNKAFVNNHLSLVALRDTLCKELRMNCASPMVVADNGLIVLDMQFFIPDDVKRGITLVVPWGCVSNYNSNPLFQGFKEIKEGRFIERLRDVIIEQMRTSVRFIHNHSWTMWFAYCSMGIVILFFFMISWISYDSEKSKTGKGFFDKWLYCILVTSGMLALLLLAFISGYAFIAIGLKVNNLPLMIFVGSFLVLLCYYIVYGNIFFNVFSKGFVKGLKEIARTLRSGISQLFFCMIGSVGNRSKRLLVKRRLDNLVVLPKIIFVVVMFLIAGTCVLLLRDYDKENHARWLQRIEALRSEGRNLEAYGLAKGAQGRTVTFFYPHFSDSLQSIKNTILNDSSLSLLSFSTPNKNDWCKFSHEGGRVFIHFENGDSRIYNWIAGDSVTLNDAFYRYRDDFTNAEFNSTGDKLAVHYHHDSSVNVFSTVTGINEKKINTKFTSNVYPMVWQGEDRIVFQERADTLRIMDIQDNTGLKQKCETNSFSTMSVNSSQELRYLNHDGDLEILDIKGNRIGFHDFPFRYYFQDTPLIVSSGLVVQVNTANIYDLKSDSVISGFSGVPVERGDQLTVVLRENQNPKPDIKQFLESRGVKYIHLPKVSDHMQWDASGRFVLQRFVEDGKYRYELYDTSNDKEERRKLFDSFTLRKGVKWFK